jgi:hypothetical protein
MTVFHHGPSWLGAAGRFLRRHLFDLHTGRWFKVPTLPTASGASALLRRPLSPPALGAVFMVSNMVGLVGIAGLLFVIYRGDAHAGKKEDARPVPDTRAWISPMSIQIARAPLWSDGKPRLDITLNYVNVGHEPARGVVVAMRSGTVRQDLSTATLDAVFAGDNTTCDSLISPDKGGIVFPSSNVPRSFGQTDILQNQGTIESKNGVLVVQACIKYQTAGAFHHTMLCEYVEPETYKPLDQRRMRSCADGNDAD